MVALGASCTCLSVVDSGNVVHTTCDEENTIRGPCQIIYLGANGAAHELYSPVLLVFRTVVQVGLACLVLVGDPEEDVAIVASRGQYLAYSTLAT